MICVTARGLPREQDCYWRRRQRTVTVTAPAVTAIAPAPAVTAIATATAVTAIAKVCRGTDRPCAAVAPRPADRCCWPAHQRSRKSRTKSELLSLIFHSVQYLSF